VFSGIVSVVAWLLDHVAAPHDVDLLVLSCQNRWGSDVFEYLADNRGYESAPEELMIAAARNSMVFDAAVLVKRYRVPLHHTYLGRAIVATDVGRIRFALSHGQVPVAMHYTQLFHSPDVGLLSEVLRARKVDGVLPEADRAHIQHALRVSPFNERAMKVLSDHAFFQHVG
jgi:hypothetical protein